MNFVIYEDRESDFIAVQLLLLSIKKHVPGAEVSLFTTKIPKSIFDWCSALNIKQPEIIPIRERLGWNSKPTCLLHLLSRGYQDATWIDSDIILSGPLPPLLTNKTSPKTIIASEEAPWLRNQGSFLRTKAWGFPIGRDISTTVNTCVLKVTTDHIPLLEEWKDLLASQEYVTFQKKRWEQRPLHMKGDQDVFTALLGSTRYSDIPLKFLLNGIDIAQCFEHSGYTIRHRIIGSLTCIPPLIHAQGEKPWRLKSTVKRPLWLQVSPYSLVARKYLDLIPEMNSWIRPDSFTGQLLITLSKGNPALAGIPCALARSTVRKLIRFIEKFAPSFINKLRNKF